MILAAFQISQEVRDDIAVQTDLIRFFSDFDVAGAAAFYHCLFVIETFSSFSSPNFIYVTPCARQAALERINLCFMLGIPLKFIYSVEETLFTYRYWIMA